MRLLLVEDDPALAEIVTDALSQDGFVVDHAADATQAAAMATFAEYALLLVDVRLPEGEDAGFELAQQLRLEGIEEPIVFLTARVEVQDLEHGLDNGGDDYITKPFELRELRARVRAVMRRSHGAANPVFALAAGWRLDSTGRQVLRGRRAAPLTRREYALLELLALNPGRVFERGDLIDRLWAPEDVVDRKVIDVYVSSLRRKLSPEVIVTVRGFGYRLGDAPQAAVTPNDRNAVR